MCSGIEFQGRKLYFRDSPEIPVLRHDGGVEWVQWGLPYGLAPRGLFPGACARLESIRSGKWKRLKPRPVRIVCEAFMERDGARAEYWFPIADTLAIQGALIMIENKVQIREAGNQTAIVYVVTEPAGPEVAPVHDRQPRLVLKVA